MTTAASLARSVLGSDARLRPVGGGDINVAFRAETPDGPVFIKCHPDPPAGMFEAEASGLRALRRHAPADLGVPEVRSVHPHGLVLEWIEPARPSATTDAGFGRDLAALHRATSDAFGGIDGSTGGYLGSARIDLAPGTDWPDTYVRHRVEPLVRQAVRAHRLAPDAVTLLDRAAARAEEWCGPPEPPTLIHGDLWAGNRMVGQDGRNWLIDPAAQWAHRELDIAMMSLFGGFDGCFAAYTEAYPLGDGWRERVDWYQLPPLLVHAILFGGGYGDRARTVLQRRA